MAQATVGLVYTSTTPELIELVNKEVVGALGDNVKILSYMDASILAEVRDNGYVTSAPAARLVGLYLRAIQDGADAILNICSSVGEVADSVQDMAKYMGVPIVRIDEEMCREAVREGSRIAVLATLPTTLDPTMNTIKRCARSMNRHPNIMPGLIDGAFGLNQDEFRAAMLDEALKFKDDADVLVFAQGSMAYCEEYIAEKTGLKVLSSPRFGAQALKRALVDLGKIEE
jgi:hypothetical protein